MLGTVKRIGGSDRIGRCSFLNNNERVIVSNGGETLGLYNLESGVQESKIDLGAEVAYWSVVEESERTEASGFLVTGERFVWNILGGKLKKLGSLFVSLPANEERTIKVVTSDVENHVAILTNDGSILLWNFDTQKVVSTHKLDHQPTLLGLVTPTILAVPLGKSVQIMNSARNLSLERTIDFQSSVTAVSFHPTSQKLVVGDDHGRLYTVTDYLSPKPRIQISHWHANAVRAISFLPGGQTTVSGGHEAVMVFWKDENTRKDFCPRLDGTITSIEVDPSGELIAVFFNNGRMRIIRTATFQSVFSLSALHTKGLKQSKVISYKDGIRIIYGGDTNLRVLKKVQNEIQVENICISGRNTMNHVSTTNKIHITHARFTDDFEYLCVVEENVICSQTFQKVKFFRVRPGPKFELMDSYTNPNSEDIVSLVSYSNNKHQKVFATVGKHGRVLEWETFKENLNSTIKWIVSRVITTYCTDIQVAELSQAKPDQQAILMLFSGNSLVLKNLSSSDEEEEDRKVQFKSQIAQNLLRIIVSGKKIVLVFKKHLVVLSSEDLSVLAAESMSHIYDTTLLDQKTLAISCKAASHCVVLTYSLETLSLISTISLETLTARVLVPFTNGIPKLAVLALEKSAEESAVQQSHQVTLTIALDGVVPDQQNETGMVNELQANEDSSADFFRSLRNTSTRDGTSLANLTVDSFMEELDQASFNSNQFDTLQLFGRSHLAPNLFSIMDYKLDRLLTQPKRDVHQDMLG